MSNYNWCHGPKCHEQHTVSRVRGSGDNKVLRTIKIKVHQPETPHIYDYFCNQNCLHSFLNLHKDRIVALDPRREARETKIKDPVKNDDRWNSWTIEERV